MRNYIFKFAVSPTETKHKDSGKRRNAQGVGRDKSPCVKGQTLSPRHVNQQLAGLQRSESVYGETGWLSLVLSPHSSYCGHFLGLETSRAAGCSAASAPPQYLYK